MNRKTSRWDIFCTVIDNYGDIGICWRLARQLANEHGIYVTLWVDDLYSFGRICQQLQPNLPYQHITGVYIRQWVKNGISFWSTTSSGKQYHTVADVVIEAFGTELPEKYVQAMADRPIPPLWYNLEYLSAETWIDSCHKLNSPHPRFPLRKKFFFPGFSVNSGGLLRERGLIEERIIWTQQTIKKELFWQQLGIPAQKKHEKRYSIFCYPTPALYQLFITLSNSPYPVSVIFPMDKAHQSISPLFSQPLKENTVHQFKQLTVYVIPFINQQQYDHLLWCCDMNIVRGEDSFIRAQWAAKPFLWHIYPQTENTHIVKLDAFLHRYTQPLHNNILAHTIRQMNLALNKNGNWHAFNQNFLAYGSEMNIHAGNWCRTLLRQQDLATQLVQDAKIWIQ